MYLFFLDTKCFSILRSAFTSSVIVSTSLQRRSASFTSDWSGRSMGVKLSGRGRSGQSGVDEEDVHVAGMLPLFESSVLAQLLHHLSDIFLQAADLFLQLRNLLLQAFLSLAQFFVTRDVL